MGIFGESRPLHYNQPRTFKISTDYTNDIQTMYKYPSNFIKTSRYTIWSFIPHSLLIQFKRYANIYFLFIAIIQSIPSISPLSPFSAIAPLVFVLAVSMIREGYEDYKRHVSDQVLNSSKAMRIENGEEKEIEWQDILVGDIIKIENNEAFPADLLVLSTEYDNGNCYIETGALDGEKNMKPKQAVSYTYQKFATNRTYDDIKMNVHVEAPTQELYKLDGYFQNISDPDKKRVNEDQLLLRGAYLRNTQFAYGVVIYTGLDTKIMRNAEPGKLKQSDIEKKMNVYILGILIFQIICSAIMAIIGQAWINNNWEEHYYLDYDKDDTGGGYGVTNFFTYFILFNTMIPISLIVSLEIVKLCQVYFIVMDQDMYVASKKRSPTAQTFTINEELGQVEYVFSDKTGTLTCNVMEYKVGIIGNFQYGTTMPQLPDNLKKKQEEEEEEGEEEFQLTKYTFADKNLDRLLQQTYDPNDIERVNPQFGDEWNIKSTDGNAKIQVKSQFELAEHYFMLMCTAHECLVQKGKNFDPNAYDKYVYGGPSPDEITLVDAAKHQGFVFVSQSSSSMNLVVQGQQRSVELLKIFKFNSDRKRMSAIIKYNGVILMYTKGADSIVKARLRPDQPLLSYVDGKLHDFSVLGLRTLLMTIKVLSQEEYDEFDKKYNDVANLKTPKEQDEMTSKLQSDIEQNLTLIGASAVEDKLQDKVPETIFDLIKANIKVWMLTGDKLETAENIGKSCKLIQNDMSKIYFTQRNDQEIQAYFDSLKKNQQNNNNENSEKQRKALLIEGDTLTLVLANNELSQQFVDVSKVCDSVICCRVNPKQKAQVVRIIKDSLNKITLAIGDGANDVNMIQEAHIGIGLYGNEGMRAVQSSDFAFGEFQCLWRLLLIHGRSSYIRISEMIIYFFYKNMLFTIPHLFFAFLNGFSGQTVFDDYYILFYNMVFTALPLIARAVFDQDVSYYVYYTNKDGEAKKKIPNYIKKRGKYVKQLFPKLYSIGQEKSIFTLQSFLVWIVQGIIHSLVIFFVSYLTLIGNIFLEDGHNADLWSFSLITFTAIFLVASSKIALHTRFWTIFNQVAFWITSILAYFVCFLLTEVLSFSNVYRTPIQIIQSAHFYLIIMLSVGLIFVIDMTIHSIQTMFQKFDLSQVLRIFMRQSNIRTNKQDLIQNMPDPQYGENCLQAFQQDSIFDSQVFDSPRQIQSSQENGISHKTSQHQFQSKQKQNDNKFILGGQNSPQ